MISLITRQLFSRWALKVPPGPGAPGPCSPELGSSKWDNARDSHPRASAPHHSCFILTVKQLQVRERRAKKYSPWLCSHSLQQLPTTKRGAQWELSLPRMYLTGSPLQNPRVNEADFYNVASAPCPHSPRSTGNHHRILVSSLRKQGRIDEMALSSGTRRRHWAPSSPEPSHICQLIESFNPSIRSDTMFFYSTHA